MAIPAAKPRFRERNKIAYRLAHWPIWIFVFFIAPGPLTFDLLEHGFDARIVAWLSAVLLATGIAGLQGRLPGVEPKPYILRFTEDKPNPLYRRICYTAAWTDLITFAILNLSGLLYAVAAGMWRLRQIYDHAYFPLAIGLWICGAIGILPRVRPSTKGEGARAVTSMARSGLSAQRSQCSVCFGKLCLGRGADLTKLAAFTGILAVAAYLAYRGKLPRTRPIVPGEWAVSD